MEFAFAVETGRTTPRRVGTIIDQHDGLCQATADYSGILPPVTP